MAQNTYDVKFNKDQFGNIICEAIIERENELQTTQHKKFKAWEMDFEDEKLPKIFPFRGCANFSVNITSSNIDGMVPRLVEDIFDYQEPIEAVAVDIQDKDKVHASTINRFLSWDIESHDDLRENIWMVIEDACVYGTGFIYTSWESEKEWVEEETRMIRITLPDGTSHDGVGSDGKPIPYSSEVVQSLQAKGIQFEEKDVLVKEFKYKKFNPKSEVFSPFDVCFNKDAASVEDAFNNGFISIKIMKTIDEIKRIVLADPQSIYSDWKKFENVLETSRLKSSVSSFGDGNYSWKPKKIEFRLVFTRADIDNDGLEEKIVCLVHVESKTIIGIEKFQFNHGMCPITEFRIKPKRNQIFGVGIAKMLWHEKGYLDSIRNQMSDNRTLHNNPIRQYTKESGYNPRIHVPGFGQTWKLDTISDSTMRVEQINTIDNNIWQEFSETKSSANQRIGMNDITKGQMPDQSMTFRGMMMLLEEGSKSRSMFKRHLAQGVQKLFYQRLRLYQQYWGKAVKDDHQIQNFINEILGANSTIFKDDVSRQSLDFKFNIVMKATNDEKKLNLVRARDKYELLINDPAIQQSPKHKRQLILDLLRAQGDKDPEGSYPDEQFLEQLEQSRVTQAQQQIAEEQQKQAEDDQARIDAMKAQEDQEEIKHAGEVEYHKTMGKNELADEIVNGKIPQEILDKEAEQNKLKE